MKRADSRRLPVAVLIHAHTPKKLGLPFALWSRAAVSALIEKECGMVLPERTSGSYLQRWGFTPQGPLDRAYGQSLAAVRAGLDNAYSAIARRAKAKGGEIFWGDETDLRSDDVRGRSYGPRGETPVVQPRHKRQNVGLTSAMTNRGTVRWMDDLKAGDESNTANQALGALRTAQGISRA